MLKAIKKSLYAIKDALKKEQNETREMFEIYLRFSKGDASKKEMKIANQQFRDILKGAGIGAFALLPLSSLTLPIIIKVGHKFGIDILPSAFYERNSDS